MAYWAWHTLGYPGSPLWPKGALDLVTLSYLDHLRSHQCPWPWATLAAPSDPSGPVLSCIGPVGTLEEPPEDQLALATVVVLGHSGHLVASSGPSGSDLSSGPGPLWSLEGLKCPQWSWPWSLATGGGQWHQAWATTFEEPGPGPGPIGSLRGPGPEPMVSPSGPVPGPASIPSPSGPGPKPLGSPSVPGAGPGHLAPPGAQGQCQGH